MDNENIKRIWKSKENIKMYNVHYCLVNLRIRENIRMLKNVYCNKQFINEKRLHWRDMVLG